MNESVIPDDHWRHRFAVGVALMVGVNMLPLWASWDAPGFDGHRRLGLPFCFVEWGGMSGAARHFYLEYLALDAVLLLLAAKLFADLSRGGFRAGLHRLRTWGTPWER